jgi:hypothetical protein
MTDEYLVVEGFRYLLQHATPGQVGSILTHTRTHPYSWTPLVSTPLTGS